MIVLISVSNELLGQSRYPMGYDFQLTIVDHVHASQIGREGYRPSMILYNDETATEYYRDFQKQVKDTA